MSETVGLTLGEIAERTGKPWHLIALAVELDQRRGYVIKLSDGRYRLSDSAARRFGVSRRRLYPDGLW